MPLRKIEVEPERAWALWEISEDENTLIEQVRPFETIPESLTNAQKRLEWVAGRVATKIVMESLQLKFQGILKDPFGKPFPRAIDFQLSLSHSFPYVAVLMARDVSVGIDLEQPKEKLLRIAPRIHHAKELDDLGTDIVKHCIYWCAKEALVKRHGRKDLVFSENLFIEPFNRDQEGDINGKIITGGAEMMIPLHYIVYTNFVVVFTARSVS